MIGDAQRDESASGIAQWHLKWSNGSRQARQRHSALQAVEPNSLSSFGVGRAAARAGDRSARTARRGWRRAAAGRCRIPPACGGPSSVIQSVVQAGDSTVRTRASGNAGALQRGFDVERDHVHRRAAGIGRRDRDLDRPSGPTDTSRSTPRSAMVSAGISGSTTRRRRRPRRAGAAPASLTMSPRDRCAARYCSSASRWPRCSLCRPGAAAGLHPAVRGRRQRRLAPARRRRVASQPARSAGGSTADAGGDQRRRRPARTSRRCKATAQSSASCARRWLSAVPSPSRISHSAAWRR